MASTPKFIQGVFPFVGHGLGKPEPVDAATSFTVPPGMTAQPLYFRGGNSSDELVVVTLTRDGESMRVFPMGAKSSVNVPLRVVEDVDPDVVLDLTVAAPEGCTGDIVVDFGMMIF